MDFDKYKEMILLNYLANKNDDSLYGGEMFDVINENEQDANFINYMMDMLNKSNVNKNDSEESFTPEEMFMIMTTPDESIVRHARNVTVINYNINVSDKALEESNRNPLDSMLKLYALNKISGGKLLLSSTGNEAKYIGSSTNNKENFRNLETEDVVVKIVNEEHKNELYSMTIIDELNTVKIITEYSDDIYENIRKDLEKISDKHQFIKSFKYYVLLGIIRKDNTISYSIHANGNYVFSKFLKEDNKIVINKQNDIKQIYDITKEKIIFNSIEYSPRKEIFLLIENFPREEEYDIDENVPVEKVRKIVPLMLDQKICYTNKDYEYYKMVESNEELKFL